MDDMALIPNVVRPLALSHPNTRLEVSTVICIDLLNSCFILTETYPLPGADSRAAPPSSPALAIFKSRYPRRHHVSGRITTASSLTVYRQSASLQDLKSTIFTAPPKHLTPHSSCDGNACHCTHRGQAQLPSPSRYHSHLAQ